MIDDPAVEAARRALITVRGHGLSTTCEIESAREALKPLRELHRMEPTGTPTGDYAEKCCTCPEYWPCATARLIYPLAEL